MEIYVRFMFALQNKRALHIKAWLHANMIDLAFIVIAKVVKSKAIFCAVN